MCVCVCVCLCVCVFGRCLLRGGKERSALLHNGKLFSVMITRHYIQVLDDPLLHNSRRLLAGVSKSRICSEYLLFSYN